MSIVCVTRPIYARTNGSWAKGLITVYMPEIDTTGEFQNETWKCYIKIEWPGFNCEKRHYGGDAYQALELALRLVPSLIGATNEFRDRNLSLYAGESILDSASLREGFHARMIGDV